MPRLPIGGCGSWLLAVMLGVLVCAPVQARVVVRSAKDLETGVAYRDAAAEYGALSAANVAFAKCPTVRPTVAEDQPYLTEQFPLAEQALLKAYNDNYVALVGYPPPQTLVDEYVARVRKLQQSVVNDMALTIQNQGCDTYAVISNVQYIHKSRLLAEAAKNPKNEEE